MHHQPDFDRDQDRERREGSRGGRDDGRFERGQERMEQNEFRHRGRDEGEESGQGSGQGRGQGQHQQYQQTYGGQSQYPGNQGYYGYDGQGQYGQGQYGQGQYGQGQYGQGQYGQGQYGQGQYGGNQGQYGRGNEGSGRDESGSMRGGQSSMSGRFDEGRSGGRGRGQFRGKGPKDYVRSDDRIREEVCELLSDADFDASEIIVKVENAEVTLEGTVDSRWAKREAEEIGCQARGAKDCQNRLKVMAESSKGESTTMGKESGNGHSQPQGRQNEGGRMGNSTTGSTSKSSTAAAS